MYLKNAIIDIFINVHLFILLINSKYPVGQEDKNRTCPVPSYYITLHYITLHEESLSDDAFHIISGILFSSAFASQIDIVEHYLETVANHSAIEFSRRKRLQSKISGAVCNYAYITSQAQQF